MSKIIKSHQIIKSDQIYVAFEYTESVLYLS